jgi:hypothetical protein
MAALQEPARTRPLPGLWLTVSFAFRSLLLSPLLLLLLLLVLGALLPLSSPLPVLCGVRPACCSPCCCRLPSLLPLLLPSCRPSLLPLRCRLLLSYGCLPFLSSSHGSLFEHHEDREEASQHLPASLQ